MDRLRVPKEADGQIVTPAVEAILLDRQKKMVEMLLHREVLTSRKCEQRFGITRDTANRDFEVLVKAGIAVRMGAVHPVRAGSEREAGNRPHNGEDRKGRQKAASVRDWHALRTTFVTLALSAAVPMELVRRVTGARHG